MFDRILLRRTPKACNSLIYRLIFCLSAVCWPLSSAYVRHFWRTIGEQLDVHKSTKNEHRNQQQVTRNGQKIWYTYEWGKGPGERKAAGIFTFNPHYRIAADYLQLAKEDIRVNGFPNDPAEIDFFRNEKAKLSQFISSKAFLNTCNARRRAKTWSTIGER